MGQITYIINCLALSKTPLELILGLYSGRKKFKKRAVFLIDLKEGLNHKTTMHKTTAKLIFQNKTFIPEYNPQLFTTIDCLDFYRKFDFKWPR